MLNRLLLISREVCLNLVLVNIRLLDYYQRREEGEEIQLDIRLQGFTRKYFNVNRVLFSVLKGTMAWL